MTGPLLEVAGFFLRLGFTAFGGPAAHIALMEQEAVGRREWLTRADFLDLLGAANLIPGPSSTQLAMSLGYRRAGWAGLALGGVCFILPASLLTLALAWGYVRFGRLPQAQGLLYGIKPVVLAIVFQALWNLGRTAFRTRLLAVLGGLALAAAFLGLHPLVVLLGAGLAAAVRVMKPGTAIAWLPMAAGGALPAVGLGSLFLFFLKLGSVLFGSGYVLLAFLKADLVDRYRWLTQAQLLDAVAVGQVTPGPVFTTATFIGYVLRGWPGALAATVGIFLPSFFFVAALGLLVPRLRKSAGMAAFLDGINVGALALMASVTWALSRAAVVDPWTAALGAASGFLLIRFKVNPTWLVLGGGGVGLLLLR
ncbi:chromate efflux transporter [Geothrix sp. 21YS21S-2]|uniref:chromate efflux transporter n=1 Tax=Geothrix sp. 21YS21S-2 TaxID=3068893 RepID=UPI0027BA5454|nr:chromate efflux transporter [Geothrix sp. 21YS21S-2]